MSLFFSFGALMSGLAAFLLAFPGTALDAAWRLNLKGHANLVGSGVWVVLLMLVVCAACVTAAVGLWRCARFGFGAAVAVLSINLAGDIANALVGHDWRTLIGVPVSGSMIVYLVKNHRVLSR
jgi:hypothetical protein